MAVIHRQRLTGQAADIKQKALQKMTGDPNVIALNQQQVILDSQQQGLIASVQSTLGQISDNIYQAQRQARAQNAAFGLIGDIATIRQQSDLQSQIGSEYANVINQAEQGAISIAGQQSALERAEAQFAQDFILDEYANQLIEQGRTDLVYRDTTREAWDTATSFFIGAASGLGLGVASWMGSKWAFGASRGKLKAGGPSPGWIGAVVGSAMAGGSFGYFTDTLAHTATDDEYHGGWGALAGGLAMGVGSLANKFFYRAMKENPDKLLGASKRISNVFGLQLNKNWASSKNFFKAGVGKLNPIGMALTVATSVIEGALSAYKTSKIKRYGVNYDALLQEDTAQQFMDLGLDLSGIVDVVYGKKG